MPKNKKSPDRQGILIFVAGMIQISNLNFADLLAIVEFYEVNYGEITKILKDLSSKSTTKPPILKAVTRT
jgi:hypothetical protein